MKASLARSGSALCLVASLVACGGSEGKPESLPSVAASRAGTPTPPVTSPPGTTASAAQPGGGAVVPGSGRVSPCAAAKLTITSDKPSYAAGQIVHVTATLVNAGTRTCTVQAGAERGFSVSKGAMLIWRSGCSSTPDGHPATEPCAQFIALMPLKAGQRLTRTQAWSQQADGTDKQVSAGSYAIAETWAGLTATVTVTIT